jgi:hypothetical protein
MKPDVDIDEKRKKAFGPAHTHAVINSLGKEENHKRLLALDRLVRAKEAATNLIGFSQFTTPDPDAPEDSSRTKYVAKRHHQALAAALEEVAKGQIKRLIISMPPRHGKTELCCVRFIPWYLAKFSGKPETPPATKPDTKATDTNDTADLVKQFSAATGDAMKELATTLGDQLKALQAQHTALSDKFNTLHAQLDKTPAGHHSRPPASGGGDNFFKTTDC